MSALHLPGEKIECDNVFAFTDGFLSMRRHSGAGAGGNPLAAQ